MIDLHVHSLFSDGVLLPSEIVRRADAIGIQALAITDHVDISNIDHVIPRIVKACEELNKYWKIIAIPGAEITHVPPESINKLSKEARKLGAKILLVHGETIVEPVPSGTNSAALNSDIDILAHPGLITGKDAELARKKSIFLEISGRKGHSFTNGHVASMALKVGAKLVFNSDAHQPDDLINENKARKVLLGCGILDSQVKDVFKNSEGLIKKVR
ncbi:MAG: PHP domain-containing protein [Nitrospinae bacterium RIFCSPLOWO2_12_39_16]|nr:MAG: PHP domain-containing protein [Nitrospinae bacterium RIFCSPLOWO2_12_39_16]